jgi:hypothetical protein
MSFAFVGNRALILARWLELIGSGRLVLCRCERKLPTCFQQHDKALSFQGYLNLSLTQILLTRLRLIYIHIKLKPFTRFNACERSSNY